jgi:hypothetical protein
MPQWKPGKQRGEVVNVSFTVPINFSLNGEMPKKSTGKKFDELTEEDKAAMIKEYREKGVELEFNDKGGISLTMIKTDKGTANPVSSNQ